MMNSCAQKIIRVAICLATWAVFLSSCKGWFDVSPATDVKASDLFKTEAGFDSAMTGIYLSMASSGTYAGDMSFGLLDQLAQQYDYIPHGASEVEAIYNYETETNGGFRTKQRLARSWQALYNVIANCNNMLKWLDTVGETTIKNPQKRNLYKGEALAIRAYCHFDLLRAWGPANYKGDPSAAEKLSVPYRVKADNSKQPLLPSKEVLLLVIKDLNAAKELLAHEAELNLSKVVVEESQKRQFRANYHAVNALLARVYNYAGDKENAQKYARAVIEGCGLSLQTSNKEDPALFGETIFGLNYFNMKEDFDQSWSYGEKFTTQYFISPEKFSTLFGVAGSRRDDMRAKSAAFYQDNVTQQLISRKYIDNSNEIIPLIRLPEMYYILCEVSADLDEAESYINLVRNKRGYSSAMNENFTNEEARMLALSKEYCKEFYAEGQYWFFLKRVGQFSLPYSEVELSKERFEFPLPDAEKQYGWTTENTVNNAEGGYSRQTL